jgi:lysophospholipase L1-like esterase
MEMNMKKINIKIAALTLLCAAIISSCKQDVLVPEKPTTVTPETPSKGSADFTKYVAIGNSLTAGFQAGALFTEGQQNSFPMILSKQFSLAQGTTLTFNQPDINSVNGYNSSYSDPAHGVIRGRLVLFAANGNIASAIPTPAGATGVPAPYNTADLPTAYTGDKSKLNNFGVPGILLGQALIPQTGGPSTGNPYYNGLYARFASNPGVSTILGDAVGTQPTFFTFDLGNNDVLGYATTGGDGSIPLTSQANFTTYYQQAIGGLMSVPNIQGAVATIPYVTNIPFFLTIKYNAIPLDQATATTLMGASAFGGYNQVMQGISATLTATPAAFGLTADQAAPIIAQIAKRYVNFAAGSNNAILITDETMVDMGPFFDGLLAASQITSGQRAGLEPYRQIRQATSDDLITLTAGAVLGTTVGGNPLYVNGVSVPLADKYVLIPSEQTEIKTATDAFNTIIKNTAAAYSTKIAVADVNATFSAFLTAGAIVSDGVMITPNFTPPFGAFSEDGVHPNSRGYAFMANIFIDAINAKFSAKVPHASLADYHGVGLPLVP